MRRIPFLALALPLWLALGAACAPWDTFAAVAPKVAAVACAAFEQAACATHTAAGIPETDPRAIAAHAAGRAADTATPHDLPAALVALGTALTAVTPR